MSARNRGMPQDVLDRRMTPPDCAKAITARLALPAGTVVIEPSAGEGAFVKALASAGMRVIACDVRPGCEAACRAAGAEEFVAGDWPAVAAGFRPGSAGAIVGNPPFSRAMEHIEAGLPLLVPGGTLAFILRIGFFDAEDRASKLWSGRGLSAVLPLRPRPSFGVNAQGRPGNDATSYAAWIFRKGYSGPAAFGPPVFWRQP